MMQNYKYIILHISILNVYAHYCTRVLLFTKVPNIGHVDMHSPPPPVFLAFTSVVMLYI